MLQVLDALVLYLELEGVHKERRVVEDGDGRDVDGSHGPVVSRAGHTAGWHTQPQGAFSLLASAPIVQEVQMPILCQHWCAMPSCAASPLVEMQIVSKPTKCRPSLVTGSSGQSNTARLKCCRLLRSLALKKKYSLANLMAQGFTAQQPAQRKPYQAAVVDLARAGCLDALAGLA